MVFFKCFVIEYVGSASSTFKYAKHDTPAISMVYLPESSTFGWKIVSVYVSLSTFGLYFLPSNTSYYPKKNKKRIK